MTDEMNQVAPEVTEEQALEANQGEQAPEANQEEQMIAEVIQVIAGLSAESQRQLMWFLNEEFATIMEEEAQEINNAPEEQSRKADVMSEAF